MQQQLVITKLTKGGSKGFTLIEMAVVIIIIGLLMASFAPLLTLQAKQKRIDTTEQKIDAVETAISAFRSVYGRYPCPASFSNQRTDPGYGHETDCSATAAATLAVAPGNCGPAGDNGFCVKRGVGTVVQDPAFPNDPTRTITIRPRIRIGAVPFRELNLPDERAMFDGYDSMITYAVTEELAVSSTYDPTHGGISILTENNVSAIKPENSAHFIVISHGADKLGARLANGAASPCPAGSLESDNCDVDTDAVFRVSQRSDSASANRYDDVVSYSLQESSPLWEVPICPPGSPPECKLNIHHKTAGGIGVANDPILGLTEKGGVQGTVRAQGDVKSVQICDSSDGNCFASSLIAGALPDAGIKCGPNEFMKSIDHGRQVCGTVPSFDCPIAGQFLVGINADGSIKCEAPTTPVPPPAPCPAKVVTQCGQTFNLPATAVGSTATINAGTSFVARYKCNTGPRWANPTTSGSCTCDPTRTQTSTAACGTGFTGTITTTQTMTCPAGTWSAAVQTANTCVCVATTQDRNQNCPTGFTGTILQRRTHQCPANTWSAYVTISNTCTCQTDTDERDVGCSGGLTGNIHQTRTFQCPAGTWSGWTTTSDTCSCQTKTESRTSACQTGYTGQITEGRTFTCPAATWGGWSVTGNTCTCTPKTETRPKDCPTGYEGGITEARNFTCPAAAWGAWAETVNTCTPKPPATCTLQTLGSPAVTGSGVQIGNSAGAVCTCGSPNQPCSRATGIGKFNNWTSCSCN